MKLTLKQQQLFEDVQVNIKRERQLALYTTMRSLYEQGWWATSIYGTTVTFVKPKTWAKDGFACVAHKIKTSVNIQELEEEIQKIADKQYEKYKTVLQPKKYKEIYDEEEI